jgi:hypothetical protein
VTPQTASSCIGAMRALSSRGFWAARTGRHDGRYMAASRTVHRVRILSVSDLHYRLPHYDWLVQCRTDADVVVAVR